MARSEKSGNRLRRHRIAKGLTQVELAARAGISRTAVTAIEGDRLVPSVASALAIARALGTTVEDLFGVDVSTAESEVWAWRSTMNPTSCWHAEVAGKTVLYPASTTPMLAELPDQLTQGARPSDSVMPCDTLVMACCDPTAGLLASQFAMATGLRLIVLPRSSRQAVVMLRDGLVHLAGMHLATHDEPDGNSQLIRGTLGAGYQSVRMAWWQEGVIVSQSAGFRSISGIMKKKLRWIGREPGSGARQCLDRIFENRSTPRRIAFDHRGVVESVRTGWADAGVCIQLVSAEAGLGFLPVQYEAFDVCFPSAMADDRRIKAFVNVVRSTAYRKLISDLPGYDTRETGNFC
jgi:putative molybdopterin biosynthesis protein